MASNISCASLPALEQIEVSTKGKWYSRPALKVHDKHLIITGRWVKKAIVHAEEWLPTDIEDPDIYIQRLKEQAHSEFHADIFTFVQKLPATVRKHSFVMEWHSVAAARITSYKDWWESLPQATRKNVRRAEKRGVCVKVLPLSDVLIRDIIEVNNDSAYRQKIPFTHYGKTFDQVKKDQSAFLDRSDYVCAYVGERLIGFLKLIYRGDVASILQILPRASEQDRRPANALIAKAVELCATKGICYLTYGMFNYGNKKDSPLREFKIRNGFEEICVPRYFVPLTMWGHMCLKLGLHKGVMGFLPSRAIAVGVRARAGWYDFKNKFSRCSSTPERPNCDRQMECSTPPAGSMER